VVRYNGGGNFSQVSVAVVNGNPNQITCRRGKRQIDILYNVYIHAAFRAHADAKLTAKNASDDVM
jgi:hypothetical protein